MRKSTSFGKIFITIHSSIELVTVPSYADFETIRLTLSNMVQPLFLSLHERGEGGSI